MSEFLLELFSEEIPARLQARASEDLKRLVVDGLKAQGLAVDAAQAFATPRRLVLTLAQVPDASPAIHEERKGPRVGAPDAAIQGFLKGSGFKSLSEATIIKDAKKGDFYQATLNKPGRPSREILATLVPDVIAKFPWPKSMRWGSGELRWIRPLKSIVCLLGGKVVPFEVEGLAAGAITRGHRFHGNEEFAVTGFEDYARKLMAKKVLLLPSEREAAISEQADALAKSAKLSLVADPGLIAENAGLTEWPTVLMGTFDKAFLDVPAECLTGAMRRHQKCFSLTDAKSGKLANRFLLVTNLVASDGGKAIIAGNEKVIRARLSDARFFWEQDLKRPLDSMASELAGITFHEKLGSERDRVERLAELAHDLAPMVDANADDARRAAQLCKADLVSGMVGEFPELQGLMGRRYAEASGTKPEIARALELHYKPKGPSDTVPKEDQGDAVAIAVALADKLDTLSGFWSIGEKPTGSGDPYQLRRAALGIIRIILENDLRVPLLPILHKLNKARLDKAGGKRTGPEILLDGVTVDDQAQDLLSFFHDRLKVYLRDGGSRHDLIDAVLGLPDQDDLALIVKRVAALTSFLKTDDGANLLAGVKRAVNILAIEEKKDKAKVLGHPEVATMTEPAEKALFAAIEKVKFDTQAAINVENFDGAMRALADLRAPVDAFFDKVTVNADDKAIRQNRLRLLAEIRDTTMKVADLGKVVS